jgi:predicted Zn-dependent protease
MDESLDALTAASKDSSGAAAYSRTAEKVLTGLRQRNPHSFKVNYLPAEVHFLSNQYNEALRALKPLAEEGQGKAEYFNLLGMSYAGFNQLQDASTTVAKAIELDPKRPDFYFNLASIYQKAGDSQTAIRISRQGSTLRTSGRPRPFSRRPELFQSRELFDGDGEL